MVAAVVDPIQEILDEIPEMSDFLEIEAHVDDAEQRSKIIIGGFLGFA
jgi:adenylate cyclase class IV